MSLYAWTQDVPIDAETYREIALRMGDAKLPGLLVHIAVERPDGTMHYIDVWESEDACNSAFAAVVHPAVLPVLVSRQVVVSGEPERVPLNVVDVRFADGVSVG
jgi:hypothetical protein